MFGSQRARSKSQPHNVDASKYCDVGTYAGVNSAAKYLLPDFNWASLEARQGSREATSPSAMCISNEHDFCDKISQT